MLQVDLSGSQPLTWRRRRVSANFSAEMIQSTDPSIRSREEKTKKKTINTAKNTNVPLLLIHLGRNLKKE